MVKAGDEGGLIEEENRDCEPAIDCVKVSAIPEWVFVGTGEY
jgi:hypothetical protein